MKFLLFCVFILTGPFLAEAKKFQTSYVSFDLLNNWHCHPEGTEWICRNKLNRKKASEAMIILTAKQKGPLDSLAQYIKYLKAPRQIKTARGRQWTSKVFHAKQRMINKHMWVDGFHQGSEVPVYYTRYLVTTKGGLAVLVTYSAHKNHYKKYASDFASSINSLRLIKGASALGKGGSMGMGGMQDHLQDMINADNELGGLGDEGTGSQGGEGLGGLFSRPETLMGLGALGSGLGYFFYKRRKKRQKPPAEEMERESRSRHRHRRRSSSEGRRSSSRSRSSSRRRHRR